MTIGSLLYFGALALWSAIVAYVVLERLFPFNNTQHSTSHTAHTVTTPPPASPPSIPAVYGAPRTSSAFNPSDGFKSFQKGTELTVEDIVTGLSRG